MPRFSASLLTMFTELDFLDRFEAVAQSGFKGVEMLHPYPYDKGQLAETVNSNELSVVGFCLPGGDFDAGEVGIACLHDRVDEFQEAVGLGIEYAKVLGCQQVVCLSGLVPEGADADLLRETFVSNLRFASAELGKAGVRLMIEPVSTRQRPTIYLQTSAQALSVIEEVRSDNLYIEYDVYHMQVMEGDLAITVQDNLGLISHIQIADSPGRHEPGTGEINYTFLLDFLDRIGYDRWVGCEYVPAAGTVEGLGWMAPYR